MSHSSSAVNTIRKPSPTSYDPRNGIFGVSLEESVNYASGSLKLGKKFDKEGNPIILGKIPVIVANCAHFLKTSNAKKVEGIFRVSGSARRIKELQIVLTDPNQNFGKNLDWSPYTVHDAANLLRRYLNNLPEPIVPLDFYQKFRKPLLGYPCIVEHLQGGNAISATTPPASAAISPLVKGSDTTDLPTIPLLQPLPPISPINIDLNATDSPTDRLAENQPRPHNPYKTTLQVSEDFHPKIDQIQFKKEADEAVLQYKNLIDQLPILNQQVLLYILDLLYFFAQNAKENLMPAVNLASIFQPSLLSHPDHDMVPSEYHLSRAVVQFLIEHFTRLTPSIQSWITYGSRLSGYPSAKKSDLEVPGQRRHSKSMSSVTIPSNIHDYIGTDTMHPPIIQPVPTLPENDSEQSLNIQKTRTPSDVQSTTSEKSSSGIFQAIRRSASISRRRTSSTSTTSSSLGYHSNTSSNSVSRQTTLSQHTKGPSSSISNNANQLSEEPDNVNLPGTDIHLEEGGMPAHKSISAVTITPKRKPVSSGVPAKTPMRVPVIKTTNINSSTKGISVSSLIISSETELSETDKVESTSVSADRTSSTETKPKVKRKSVSGMLANRSSSPTLTVGQTPLLKGNINKSSHGFSSETSVSIDSALASPAASTSVFSYAESQTSTSPRSRPQTVPSGIHSNDSSSSFGANESDEDGAFFKRSSAGVIANTSGATDSQAPSSPNSSRGLQRRGSRWRRSLIAMKMPISGSSPTRSPDPAGAISPTSSVAESIPTSPGRRILRKINHRRNRSSASKASITDEAQTNSGAADTSDSGASFK